MADRLSLQEHEARRYRQIAQLERALCEAAAAIQLSKAHTKELQERRDGILGELRAAARDEGDLPLLDMMDDLAVATVRSAQ